MRLQVQKYISDVALFKEQLLLWASQFHEVIYLDSNRDFNVDQLYANYDLIVAVDAFTSIKTDTEKAFEDLYQYQSKSNDWIFGYLSYDLKNDIEELKSENFDGLGFPDLYFFQPKKLFFLKDNILEIRYLNLCDDEIESDFDKICTQNLSLDSTLFVNIKPRISKEIYLDKTTKMLQHIQRGDIYEANFCIEFYDEDAKIDPISTFKKLNSISTPPFAVFFKNHSDYLLSASPERYLMKKGTKIISQPIKGTAKRSQDEHEDWKWKMKLKSNAKEISENIMIVDLVRNDLSHTATKGSVQVEELCKVYSFKQVHQMISTITSEIALTTSPIEVLRTTFPMGSMTGAPKTSAMKIIEKLEETKRGLYSGAVGYFTPEGNFDFNVVIRSILYQEERRYLSFSVGSAITSKSKPSEEYEECLVKAQAMFQVLNQ
ncbi:anthranilate synthase component I family protein [Flavobacterium sp.]|uniref:anthranilate synthase component I family protein n=1 Tax=Flavobacterium sp. TaxID=239 RepID=UPI0035B0ADE9